MSSYESTVTTPVAGLVVDLTAGVLSVTLDRPESLNSVTVPVLAGMSDVLEAAAIDPAVKVVRLGGAGRSFCSGVSINVDDWYGAGSPIDITEQTNRAVRVIVAMPKPVVSVVQGPAVGIGISLVLASDVVLASAAATFALAFTKVALMPDGGTSATLAAAIGRTRAMRMALLNEPLSAAEALDCGLISAVHSPENLAEEAGKVVHALVAGPMVAFAKAKEAINAATLTQLEPAFERELHGQAELVQSNDFIEGATAFQQRRPPVFTDSSPRGTPSAR